MQASDQAAELRAALQGRYRLRHELGRGGMAVVYLAEDVKHDRQVALKALHPELSSAMGAERFLKEIAVTARLQHPHVLPLFESGTAAGQLFYVMPFVEGKTLQERLIGEKQLPVDEALRITGEIAGALAYAHGRGVIHRDIKPANILFQAGHALVADFGIARAISAAGGAGLTATGLSLGTPQYMSPEQATGERDLDARSDVYSLSCVLYEMLAGEPPVTGPNPQAILAKLLTERPTRLRVVRDTVPESVEETVARALSKRPADRFATVQEFAAALASDRTGTAHRTRLAGTRHELTQGQMLLTAEVCRRLDRDELNPRMIGDHMTYLDNGAESDVLVCYMHGFGGDQNAWAEVLERSPYRGVAPTLYGFEPARPAPRTALSLTDHVTLLRHFLHDMVEKVQPTQTVLAGFSSGADVSFQLLSRAPDDEPSVVDGFLALGANLSLETCFVSGALAHQPSQGEAALLEQLNKAGPAASSVGEWLNVHEYLVEMLRKFQTDLGPLHRHGQDIVRPFQQGGDPFAQWFRDASPRVKALRCVFSDTPLETAPLRRLLLAHIDRGVLGEHYREDSIVIQEKADHMDLKRLEITNEHVSWLVRRLQAP